MSDNLFDGVTDGFLQNYLHRLLMLSGAEIRTLIDTSLKLKLFLQPKILTILAIFKEFWLWEKSGLNI